MHTETTLNQLKQGECASVTALWHIGIMRRRLCDVGLIEGTEVECLGYSPGGDPGAYLIRGAVIAIRSEDAQLILVQKTRGGGENGINQSLDRSWRRE